MKISFYEAFTTMYKLNENILLQCFTTMYKFNENILLQSFYNNV